MRFVVYPTHRLLKRRNAVSFTRRLGQALDLYQAGQISFAELDASVRGWINTPTLPLMVFDDQNGLSSYQQTRAPAEAQTPVP